MILVSVIFYSSLVPLLKKASQKLPAFTVMTVSMFALFISSLLLAFLFEKGIHLKPETKNSIFILILVGILNAVGFWLAIQAYKYLPVWQQTMFSLLTPVLAGIFAYFILGESLSPRIILGLAIIGAGLYIALR